MKKILVILALLLLASQGKSFAQQQEPLAMRVLVDWTVAGSFGGVAVGIGVWLTDPGRPGNKLSEQIAGGAAWGAVAGAVYGVVMLNQTAKLPIAALEPGPLHPANRIASDPIGDEANRQDLLAGIATPAPQGYEFSVPVLNLRF